MHIEAHYALAETPDSQLESIETVGHLVELIDSLRGHDEPSVASDFVDVAIASDHAGVELKAELVKLVWRPRPKRARFWGQTSPSRWTTPDFARARRRARGGQPSAAGGLDLRLGHRDVDRGEQDARRARGDGVRAGVCGTVEAPQRRERAVLGARASWGQIWPGRVSRHL